MSTTCGICTFTDGEEPRYCSICLKHLCKGVVSIRSFCRNCLIDSVVMNALQKDDKGRLLDPARRTPINTCICGLPMFQMSPCTVAWIHNGSTEHRPIR